MLIVSDPTIKGLTTVKRVQELSGKLLIKFGAILVVMNKVTPEGKPLVDKAAQENGIDIMTYIPYDPEVARSDILGRPITELPSDSPFSLAMDEIYGKILQSLDLFAQTKS
jgi:CO dehydrogenase maturation factor